MTDLVCARGRVLRVWNGVARIVRRIAVHRLVRELQPGVHTCVARGEVRGEDLDVRLLTVIFVCKEATERSWSKHLITKIGTDAVHQESRLTHGTPQRHWTRWQ